MSRSACSRWAERQARRTTRSELGTELGEREQSLLERLGSRAEQPLLAQRERVADEALRLDLLGHLPQGHLAERLEVLDAEEVLQRGLDAPLRVDAPSRRRVMRASGVMSTSTTSSASASSRSGNVSRTSTPVSSATWSLSDSRCWTLTVVNTSMPGLEQLPDVLVALAVLQPRGLEWASSSTRHSSGARARSPGRSISRTEWLRWSTTRRGCDLQPLRLRGRLRPAVRLEHADDDVAPVVGRRATLLQHAVGLADPRRHAQEDLAAARPTQAPRTPWTTRSMSLMPMNGVTSPPRP